MRQRERPIARRCVRGRTGSVHHAGADESMMAGVAKIAERDRGQDEVPPVVSPDWEPAEEHADT